MKHFQISTLFLIYFTCNLVAQNTFPISSVNEKKTTRYAFTHCTLIVEPGKTLEDVTLIIKDGIVENSGKNIPIPPDAQTIDLTEKFIYPSFIDLYSGYGLPKQSMQNKHENWGENLQKPAYTSSKKGAWSWNESIHPETSAKNIFKNDSSSARILRKSGFGCVLTHFADGIVRGSALFTTLGDEPENLTVLKEDASLNLSFSKGSSKMEYPSSLMGSIALLRQTYLDAKWYKEATKAWQENPNQPAPENNISLESFNRLVSLPQIFETNDKYNILRADKIGDEFGFQYIIKSGGDEYQRLKEIKETGADLIVPMNFPKPYDVENPYEANYISLREMKHWEMAKFNLSELEKSGIEFAITSSGLDDPDDFLKNLRLAVEYGLTPNTALKSLTYTPAKLIRMEKYTGTLSNGKIANFIITSGHIFNKESIIYENWIQGKPYRIKNKDEKNISGIYTLKMQVSVSIDKQMSDSLLLNKNLTLKVEDKNFLSLSIQSSDTGKIKVETKRSGNNISFYFAPGKKTGFLRLNGIIFETRKGTTANAADVYWQGKGQLPSGEWLTWIATRDSMLKDKSKDENKKPTFEKSSTQFPNAGYGWTQKPVAETILFKNATIWTNEKEGIIKNGDVLIQNGKISQVGQNLKAPAEIKIVDITGKHLTSGIIDEHSHIAIGGGVNESGQSVSAEVRIGDVINPDDINIYRQLAGGVTASQLLHGSANVIGGQSSLVKLRWGSSPEEMKIQQADGFIKLALGENVKQSNWGERYNVRFPQTRMGVEQIHKDAFTRAKEYKIEWSKFNVIPVPNRKGIIPPRKDLELECLNEILDNKRFITCHSYVQSEINQLMKTSREMGFKVNTFTHILEGYKVADKMKEYGVGASSFADWWAYKYEVMEAIPYNGAILNKMGVITAFNSDDAEMGRRLNQEAAKAIKYGNISEEEALKFVTLNPAKLLHLDGRMGSIRIGKDADLVLWSDNPLSVYAKVEKTFVDGILYFDMEKDSMMRKEIAKERARIIQKMLEAKQSGEKTQKPAKRERRYSCAEEGGDE